MIQMFDITLPIMQLLFNSFKSQTSECVNRGNYVRNQCCFMIWLFENVEIGFWDQINTKGPNVSESDSISYNKWHIYGQPESECCCCLGDIWSSSGTKSFSIYVYIISIYLWPGFILNLCHCCWLVSFWVAPELFWFSLRNEINPIVIVVMLKPVLMHWFVSHDSVCFSHLCTQTCFLREVE